MVSSKEFALEERLDSCSKRRSPACRSWVIGTWSLVSVVHESGQVVREYHGWVSSSSENSDRFDGFIEVIDAIGYFQVILSGLGGGSSGCGVSEVRGFLDLDFLDFLDLDFEGSGGGFAELIMSRSVSENSGLSVISEVVGLNSRTSTWSTGVDRCFFPMVVF